MKIQKNVRKSQKLKSSPNLLLLFVKITKFLEFSKKITIKTIVFSNSVFEAVVGVVVVFHIAVLFRIVVGFVDGIVAAGLTVLGISAYAPAHVGGASAGGARLERNAVTDALFIATVFKTQNFSIFKTFYNEKVPFSLYRF